MLRILIVDDHPGMRVTLVDILEDEGFKVDAADSGEMAIQLCQKNKYDIILMDVRMPGIDGVETFRQIKNFAEFTRVIMMSAYTVEELRREALNEGAVAFLQKPLDVGKVIQLIREAEHPPVLIVMREKEERERLSKQLKEDNYRTYISSTADEALELARQVRFSLIMIDTKLQNGNGLDLYLTLKQITPTSVTIMLAETDEHFLAQAEEAVRQSAYTFLKKPLDLDRLLSILQKLRRQQRSSFIEKPGQKND